jgi:hypothetical protein
MALDHRVNPILTTPTSLRGAETDRDLAMLQKQFPGHSSTRTIAIKDIRGLFRQVSQEYGRLGYRFSYNILHGAKEEDVSAISVEGAMKGTKQWGLQKERFVHQRNWGALVRAGAIVTMTGMVISGMVGWLFSQRPLLWATIQEGIGLFLSYALIPLLALLILAWYQFVPLKVTKIVEILPVETTLIVCARGKTLHNGLYGGENGVLDPDTVFQVLLTIAGGIDPVSIVHEPEYDDRSLSVEEQNLWRTVASFEV